MKFSVLVLVLTAALALSPSAEAASYDERQAFMEDQRAVATTIGIMKFCKNPGLERALLEKAAQAIIENALAAVPKKEVNDSEDFLQALDFHAVGVGNFLRLSGHPELTSGVSQCQSQDPERTIAKAPSSRPPRSA